MKIYLERKFVITVSIILLALSNIGLANDWPQWRGPDRDGIIKEQVLLEALPESLNLQWKAEVGKGYGSPVVSGERIYLLTRKGENELVGCYKLANGEVIWQQEYPAPFKVNQYAVKFGKGPFSTPILHEGMLYTLGIGGILSCFDAASGELKWRNSFSEKPLDTSHFFVGTAMSPLIEDGICFIHLGEENSGKLLALDAKTGEEKWRWEGDKPGYASPIAATLGGVRQIITLSQTSCLGIDIENGKLLWQIPYASEWKENIITPLIYNEKVIYSGVNRGTSALQLKEMENEWATMPAWHNDDITMYMSTPVLLDGKIYGLSHTSKGQFFCMDAETGETDWLSAGRQGQNAAVVAAGDCIIALTTNADMIVFKQGPQAFELVRQYSVAESATWAYPILLKNQIIIKDEQSLLMWGIGRNEF